MLIHSRIIDYYRKNKKEQLVYPFTYFQQDDDNNFEETYLASNVERGYENIESEDEISLFKQRLKELLKLVDVHQRTIERNRKFIIAICLIIKVT